jgi:hypothetical protein
VHGVACERRHDLLAGQEAIGRVILIRRARQPKHPIGGDERKAVPAVILPDMARQCRLFENEMWMPLLGQPIAGRQPCLASTDNHDFDPF